MIKVAIISLLFLLSLSSASPVLAQEKGNQIFGEEEEKKPSTPEEFRTRAEIERVEERRRKLVAATEELNRLSQEVGRSVRKMNFLTTEDQKKLGKIEKIAKQVRTNQGGAGDEDLPDPPGNLTAAVEQLEKAADDIEKEMCRTTRHGISVLLIEKTNQVIGLTKMIKKLGTRQ
jgi:hypothetical protein